MYDRRPSMVGCRVGSMTKGNPMDHVTRYAKSGDVHIAYQVLGDGPRDLVAARRMVSS
jgi:hypothetical protein